MRRLLLLLATGVLPSVVWGGAATVGSFPVVGISSDGITVGATSTGLNVDLGTQTVKVNPGIVTVTPGSGTWPTGGVVSTSPFNLAIGSTNTFRLDTDGSIFVDIDEALPTGTNNIGTVSGSTVAVVQGSTWTATPDTDLSTTSTLGALNATAILNTNGISGSIISITGVWVGTIVVEGSLDGFVTSQNVTLWTPPNGFITAGVSANGYYRPAAISGFKSVRLRMSNYTSGIATVTLNASEGVASIIPLSPIASSNLAMAVPPKQELTRSSQTFMLGSGDISCGGAGSDNPVFLISNPASSGKTVLIGKMKFTSNNSTTRNLDVKLWSSPTVTANGTQLSTANAHVGFGNAAVLTTYSGPTVSANGTTIERFSFSTLGSGFPDFDFETFDYSLQLAPGTSLLVTCNPSGTAVVMSLSMMWGEQ